MQLTIRRTTHGAACTALALNLLGAIAAPQDSTANGPQQSNGAVGSAESGTDIDSRTVQILLDIQSSKPPSENAGRSAASTEGPARAPVAVQGIGGLSGEHLPMSVLKSKKDSIEPEARNESLQWTRPASNSPREASENPRRAMVSSADSYPASETVDPDAPGWLPTSIMRFVRQNREVVLLVCVLALGLAAFFTASATKKR